LKKTLLLLLFFCCQLFSLRAQNIAQLKKDLESAPNPIEYVKKLNKKYSIDTISVYNTSAFVGLPDSLAYRGKIGKVYGPYKSAKGKYIVQILTKAPNTFFHVEHILIDTSIFRVKFADSLAGSIIARVQSGKSTFESMARTYSADYSSVPKGGDLGWFSRGSMQPEMEAVIVAHKKGDMFKLWSKAGLHVIRLKDDPKQDTGFALILKVML